MLTKRRRHKDNVQEALQYKKLGSKAAFVLPTRPEVAFHQESDLLGSALGGLAGVWRLVRW
jgi:hypothetical protein